MKLQTQGILRAVGLGVLVAALALSGCAQVGDLTAESQAKAAQERSGEWDGTIDPTAARLGAPADGRDNLQAPGTRASNSFR